MTVLNENEDLISIISYVKALTITENIYLVGHSQGGASLQLQAKSMATNR
jgi:triacylglycerol esterase/lipase EstA (alpha/beta hydrolase family)